MQLLLGLEVLQTYSLLTSRFVADLKLRLFSRIARRQPRFAFRCGPGGRCARSGPELREVIAKQKVIKTTTKSPEPAGRTPGDTQCGNCTIMPTGWIPNPMRGIEYRLDRIEGFASPPKIPAQSQVPARRADMGLGVSSWASIPAIRRAS